MNAFVLVPLALGMMSVLQNTLNRDMSQRWGLAGVILVNVLVMLLASLALAFCAAQAPPPRWLPEVFVAKGGLWRQLRLMHVVPGLFGLAVITGLPLAMTRLSAAEVFVVFMGTQLLTSLAWDCAVARLPLTSLKVAGAFFTLVGMVLVNWKAAGG
ncbi:MAG: DMT family transporter [Myxococcota bacterium]